MTQHIIRLITILFMSVSAQAIAKSASETARDFYDSLKHENYSAAARYFDPAALREFRLLMNFGNEITDEQKQVFYQEIFQPDLTDESIKSLSDADFLAAFLHGVLTSESFSHVLDYKNLEIIGELEERRNLVHVLTRQRISLVGHEMELVEVVSFNRIGDEWKIRMTGKLKGVAVMIRYQFLNR